MNALETFQTERLRIRKVRKDDAPIIFESYAQDPEVTRYSTWKPHKDVHETERFLSACLELWRAEKDFEYAITLKDNGRLIGMFGIHPMNFKIEVGYVLACPYWTKAT
jgi:ribosomal-protein-alanine N-acetyltransferase